MADGFGSQNFGNLGQPFAQGMSALGSPFTNIPQTPRNGLQNTAAPPQAGGMQGGDVPAFDLPPMQQIPFNPMMGSGMPQFSQGMPAFPNQQMAPNGMAPNGMSGNQNQVPQMSQDDIINMLYQAQLGNHPNQGGPTFPQQAPPMNNGVNYGANPNMISGPQLLPEIMDALRIAMAGRQY